MSASSSRSTRIVRRPVSRTRSKEATGVLPVRRSDARHSYPAGSGVLKTWQNLPKPHQRVAWQPRFHAMVLAGLALGIEVRGGNAPRSSERRGHSRAGRRRAPTRGGSEVSAHLPPCPRHGADPKCQLTFRLALRRFLRVLPISCSSRPLSLAFLLSASAPNASLKRPLARWARPAIRPPFVPRVRLCVASLHEEDDDGGNPEYEQKRVNDCAASNGDDQQHDPCNQPEHHVSFRLPTEYPQCGPRKPSDPRKPCDRAGKILIVGSAFLRSEFLGRPALCRPGANLPNQPTKKRVQRFLHLPPSLSIPTQGVIRTDATAHQESEGASEQ